MPITEKVVKDLTQLGQIVSGDKLVGERVAGQTRNITYAPGIMTGTLNRLTATLTDATIGSYTYDISANYVGQSSIITLGTITIGTWQASTVVANYGGTGRTSHTAYAPICGGTTSTAAQQSTLAGSAGQIFQSSGAAALPVWSTATYPATAGTSGTGLKSNGTNWIHSTTTMPDAGTTGKLIRGDGVNYSETTSTFADTYTASNLLYSNGANTVTGLATANSGVLVTSGVGVPSIGTDIPTAVTIGGAYVYRQGGTAVNVATGGTGLSTMTAYGVLCGGTTSTGNLQSLAAGVNSGDVLTSNGAGALPSFQATAAVAATQSDQVTATSTTKFVSPGRQQYHPSAVKVWGYAKGDGTSLFASYNVTSITDVGTGQITFNFTTNFTTANWSSTATLLHTGSPLMVWVNPSITASAATYVSVNTSAALTDPSIGYGMKGCGTQ